MAKQLNVNLAFSADTGKAKAQIQDLQNSLNNLVKSSAAGAVSKGLPITKDLMEAQTAASKLQTILSQSMNTKTGNLDLTKFSESLNKANLNITKLENSLTKLGPEGQKAFMSLTQSIVSADVPLRRTNVLVSEMWTTMKNTARWQLSSSVLHGFMGSLQSAMGYARDLDESLNNIRIVTGQNVDQMAAFADRANKAAKALSATTTQYTNASLIYYQQGLSDAEVQERADITIKMAHASGQSAEIVSDQLTAVWNNFAKGGEDLEHFADVMTALGAATASSSDEIAGGLEKFASIAEMIGLSYEYAASALATITATTRQSEDVVGTALKTIFARIQGLNLGETLDDGTTLNKYSEALQKVGISVFEQNGELKNMDNILNEMGSKWETLSKDQQVALAQTVAGVRQYNQLVSLMDNWDFFQENLEISNNSEGALQEQADIYAESWQAARDRVKAAAQDIYDSILDPNFFITFLNGLEDVLSGVANLTDALGGLPGILSLLGVVGTRVFNKQMNEAVERTVFNIKSLTGVTQRAASELQEDALKAAQNIHFNSGTEFGDKSAEVLKNRLTLQQQIKQASEGVSEELKEQLQSLLSINDAYGEQLIQLAKEKDMASNALSDASTDLRGKAQRTQGEMGLETFKVARQEMEQFIRSGLEAEAAFKTVNNALNAGEKDITKYSAQLDLVEQNLRDVGRTDAANKLNALRTAFINVNIPITEFQQKMIGIVEPLTMMDDTTVAAAQSFQDSTEAIGYNNKEADSLANTMRENIVLERTLESATNDYTNKVQELTNKIRGFKGALDNLSKSIVNASQGISSILMGLSSLKAAWDTLNNPDLSVAEKVMQITTSLTMAIPSLIMGYDALKKARIGETLASVKSTLATALEMTAKDKATAATLRATAGVKGYIIALWAQAAAALAASAGISTLTAALGIAGAAILAVAGVVFLLVKAFNKIKESSPEGQLNKLNSELSKAEEGFNRVTEATNKTKEAIDSLESGYDKLQTLTEGTKEWTDQIDNLNTEILKLLETYPELSKFLTKDKNNGLTLEGGWKDYLNSRNSLLENASNNLVLNKRKEILDQEREIFNSSEAVNLDYIEEFKNNQKELLKLAQEAYTEAGEDLFTTIGSKDFYNSLLERDLIKEENSYGKNQLNNFLQSNYNNIKDNSYQRDIDLIESQQLNSKLNLAQTNRTAKQTLDLLQMDSYSSLMEEVEKTVKEDFGKWQDYTNFTNSNQKEKIAEFAELQGIDGAIYKGQEFGNMVLEDAEGQEYKFNESEFYEGLTELRSVGILQEMMSENIKSNLEEVASFKNKNLFEDLGIAETINLDNVLSALQTNMGYEGKGYDDSLVNNLIGKAYGGDQEGIAQFTEDTADITWNEENTKKFQDLLSIFENSDAADKVAQLTSGIRELNAESKMEGMADTFASAAENLGFDDEVADEMHDYAKHLMEVADESELLSDELDENADAAADVSIAITRMNRGIDTLADNFADWNSILKKSDKSSAEYSKAINGMRDALSDVLNVESDIISNDFIEEHLDEIKKAATGDAEAINALKDALATDLLLEVTGKTNLDEVDKEISDLHDKILSMDDEIQVGATLDSGEFLKNAQKLVEESGMTVDQAQAYFNSLGYEPEFVTEEKTQTRMVPSERTHTDYELSETKVTADLGPFGTHTIGLPGFDRITTTSTGPATAIKETIQVPAFGVDKPQIKSLTKTSSGIMNNYSSSNSGGKRPGKSGKTGGGGGGGSKSKPAEKVDLTKRSNVVDRYKEIDDTLDDIEDAMSDVNKEADRLFGSARLKAMRQEKDLLLQQADALRKKKLEAENYYNTDRQSLITESAKYGITWEFGEDGDIINYTDQMNKLFNELNAAEIKMNGLATKEAQDEYKTATIEPIQQKIEDIKDALSQYEDTKELLKDLDNQLQEAIWAWQDKNFEELEYKLELKLDIEDADLKHLDYLMNKWSDDFFKMAETAALMYNPNGYDQVEGYRNQLENYREHELSLKEKYANNEISQADYIEGLKNVRDGYYEQLEALNELDKKMLHYYEDTLAAGAEELSDYTDHMEHLTEVFDHYLNLMDILGKNKDYKAIGNFLEGRAETLEDQLKVSKDYYEILVEDKAKIEKELNNALRSGSEEDKKYWKEQWDAIVDAVDEAQDQMLSLTEEWASAMKETIQNNMTKLADELEKALTDGIGFEFLMDEFDKLNTRQEEYLTKTNQIYETNKLIRQASQKIDETDNKVAKQKMQNFITETKSLQENNQLSEYELEIQQAKYELLLAEIALEEAQNAKSTVRLSRDSEGNFGYVYTADQDAIDDAEQGLDDAKNRLYNLSLEGQQKYTEKYLQAQQSMYDELAELQQLFLDGEIATQEEYEQRREAIVQHYYGEGGVLWTYSKLYNVAVQTDAAATADYWGKEYGEMTQHTEDWQVAVNDYLEQVEDETEDWADVSEKANRIVEDALKDSKNATKDLTNESGNLSKKIRNDLLPAMEKEYNRIIKNTIEYGKERDAILDMIAAYEKYLELINQEIKDESNEVLDDNYSKKDYSLSALINAAEGNMEAAYKDIDKRNEKIKDDDNYSDKTSSLTKKKVDAVDKLSDTQKEAIANSLKYLEEQGKYTTEQVDIILKQNGASFATGGFTGAWGPEGKLAFLHEKELVLNQDDTSNLLKTISFIREIVNMIDNQVSFANLGFLSTPGFSNAIDHNFEQTVSIYAEFPSATNHTEIEEAFNNLLNTASQYANRKN